MKHLHIITAKIKPTIYTLIQNGTKHYEIRDESFQDADIICYVSSDTGRTLGIYTLGRELALNRATDDDALQQLSGLDPVSYYRMFTKQSIGTKPVCYAAHIGHHVNDIMSLVNPSDHTMKGSK